MHVLIIYPMYEYGPSRTEPYRRYTEQLGICYIGGYLREKGHTVELLDARVKGFNLESTINYMSDKINSYQLIGISSPNFDYDYVIDTIAQIRQLGYKGHITLGGFGPTTNWKKFLEFGADTVIIGEGEVAISELANMLETNEDWHEISGIAYINDKGEKTRNGCVKLIENLDDNCFPARDILLEVHKKHGVDFTHPNIQATRGCYAKCAYCSGLDFINEQGGTVYRSRSVKNVVKEIYQLNKSYGFRHFLFVDDNFFPINKEQAFEKAVNFRNELLDRGLKITFFMEFRPEVISLKFLETMSQAGLVTPYIGLESFNDSSLSLYNRGYTAEVNHNAIKTFIEAGYLTDLNAVRRFKFGYINFNPLSTLEELKESGDYFKQYGMTYKKLYSFLTVYDIQDKISKRIKDKFPEYDGRNYKDPRVGFLFNHICKYSEMYALIRNQLRHLEKVMLQLDSQAEFRESVEGFRRTVDDMFFYSYMNGVQIAMSEENNEKAKKILEEFFKTRMEEQQKWMIKNKNSIDSINREVNVYKEEIIISQ